MLVFWVIVALALLLVLLKINTIGAKVEIAKPQLVTTTTYTLGVEPVLPPDINDPLVWLKTTKSCDVGNKHSVTRTEYAKKISDNELLFISILSLGDVRVAIRAGLFEQGQGTIVEVSHVRTAPPGKWILY